MKTILEKWKKINLIAKIWIICMLVIFILLIMVLWADSRDNGFIENELVETEKIETKETSQETENLLEVLVTNNKREEEYIKVDKNYFINQLNEDLDKIYHEYLSDETIISSERAYSIMGLYDTKNEKFHSINYFIFFEIGNVNSMLSAMSLEDECVPYAIMEGEKIQSLVSNDILNSMQRWIDIMGNYTFKDDYVIFRLIDGTDENAEIDKLLIHE